MKPISKRTYFFFCCIHLKNCTISLTHLPNIYKGHPLGLKALRSEKIVSFSDQCIPNLPHFLYSKQYREDMMYTPQPSARNLNIHLQIRRVITVQASTYCILVTGVRWRVITLWWVTSDQYVTACSACSACTRQILIAGGGHAGSGTKILLRPKQRIPSIIHNSCSSGSVSPQWELRWTTPIFIINSLVI